MTVQAPETRNPPPHRDIRDGIPQQMQHGLDKIDEAMKPRPATDNEVWPDPLDTMVEDGPEEAGPNALTYRSGDKAVSVTADVNPGLYDYLTRLKSLNDSPETVDFLKHQASENGAKILTREGDLPKLGDIEWMQASGDGLSIRTRDGETVALSRQLAPETFERADEMKRTLEGIHMSEQNGYELVGHNDFTNADIDGALIGPPDEVGPGVIRAEVGPEGDRKKIVVSEETNPELFERLNSTDSARRNDTEALDKAREGADLAKVSETDPLTLETSEVDPNDDKKKLNVGELAWQNMIKSWETGVADGTIGKDDDRAKLYDALRARSALDGGLDMVTLDIQTGQNITKANAKDMAGVIDGVGLDQATNDLFSSEAVQKDLQGAYKDALGKAPDADKLRDKLEKTAFSEDYVKHIQALKADGQGGLAEADIAQTYASLSAFDPEKAGEFAQNMMIDSTVMELDALMGDTSQINDENAALATKDTTQQILSAIKKGGIDLPRRTVESIDKFVNEFLNDKQTAGQFNKALQQLGDTFEKNGSITQGDIDGLLKNGTFAQLNEQTNGGMLSTLSTMNSNGTLGSAGGMVSLASGIYQLAGKGGTLADTPEERLAIAKEFVSAAGATQHFVNLGTNIYDHVNKTGVNKMLGLDKTLPEIFGKDTAAGAPFDEGKGLKFVENLESIIDAAPLDSQKSLSEKLNLTEAQALEVRKGMENGFAKNAGIPDSTKFSRGAGAFLRVLDAGANGFVGVADAVLGGLSIKKGVQSGDGVMIAQGAVQAAAGAFSFAGGAAQGAALAGSAVGRALAGPLLWVGAALNLALTPFMIVEDIKHNNKMDARRDDLNDLFGRLGDQGVLHEDGAKRWEFLDEYIYGYGQRDAPDDQSIFDYRSEEYDFWLAEGHLPEEGWDDVEHKDYDGDGPNLDTQMD